VSDGGLDAIARDVARVQAENARLLERLGEGERRFRLISRGILRLQEAERGRISRELHDGVGQSLTALKLALEVLAREAGRDPVLAGRLPGLVQIAERALTDVRQLSRLLRPQMLDELGLEPTLRWLARSMQDAGLAVDLAVEGLEDRVPADLETIVFRLVQEALANAARHSGASSAAVGVRRDGDRILLSVTDGGRGFDAARALAAGGPGGGLQGMRDRVQLFGGRFQARSAPGAGTAIEVALPLAPEE
jgi:signal transduction histidine kinase